MAKPSDITYVRGTRDTADDISQQKPIEIGDKIWTYDPNGNKFLAWVLRNQTTKAVKNHIFSHLEKAPFPNWVEFAGANESSQGATGLAMKTGHGARLTLGSRVWFPRIDEIIYLTAVMATDSTGAVSRNYGKGNASTSLLRTGDRGLILSPVFQQGFATGLGLTSNKVIKEFATSEVNWPVQVTNIENAELARGGNIFKENLADAWKQAKDQMEAELLVSGSKIDTTLTNMLTTSEGMDNIISTHVYSASMISRADLWDIIAEWPGKRKGGAIVCSTAFKNMVTMWSMGMMTMDQDAKADGMSIDQVKTPSGTFDLIDVDLLDQQEDLMGTVFFVPKGHIQYRPLSHYENLDVRYNPISRDEVHSKEGEIYGAYGWEFYVEEMFAKLSGLRFAA